MKIIILILTMQVQTGSHTQQVIKAHPGCSNRAELFYHVEAGLVCVPTDAIFLSGFQNE